MQHQSMLEDHANKYIAERIDALIAEMRWNDDRFPEFTHALDDIGCISAALDDPQLRAKLAYACQLYAKTLAEQAYRCGILDGGRIQLALMNGELPPQK